MRAIEIKLSQGAKPGLGGLLPAAKVTPDIAAVRGVPAGEDCVSPPDALGVLGRRRADRVRRDDRPGDRAAGRHQVGRRRERLLAAARRQDGRHRRRAGLRHRRRRRGRHRRRAARVLRPRRAPVQARLLPRLRAPSRARASRRTSCSSAPGASASPTRRCSRSRWAATWSTSGARRCSRSAASRPSAATPAAAPPGVATQSRWLMHGLDPELKSSQAANYLVALRAEILALARSCGERHPALVRPGAHRDRQRALPDSATSRRRSATRTTGPLLSEARRAEIDRLIPAPRGARTGRRRAPRTPLRTRPPARCAAAPSVRGRPGRHTTRSSRRCSRAARATASRPSS